MERLIKFALVGTLGFIINTIGLTLGVRLGLCPSIAGPLGAEMAIFSNFIFNNVWTFADKKITDPGVLIPKFIQFNLLSLGSVLIQFIFLKIGEIIFGLKKFKEPFIDQQFFAKLPLLPELIQISLLEKIARKFSAYFIVYMFGIGIGLIVNFLVYSLIIWK